MSSEESTTASPDDSSEAPASEDVSRRWLIRLLVALGLGIPIAVESRTLYGIITGEGGERSVGLGDELLTATPQPETVLDSAVHQRDTWTYELTVEVENTADAPYELVVGPLYLEEGTVNSTATSGEIPPGETGKLDAVWSIPAAGSPVAVDATATWGGERVTERVELASPVVYHD